VSDRSAAAGLASWPKLGLGTWRMGEQRSARAAEVAALRAALEMGWRLLDTAEMYGEGGAEQALGLALHESLAANVCSRQDLVVVSKVYPHHASRRSVVAACERSLKRLGLEHLDLYLLHWRGQEPLAETVAGFEELQRRGWITDWGVSNFDVADLEELWVVPGGQRCRVNQVYHSLGERGVEVALLPWMRAHGVLEMAYSPVDQGTLLRKPAQGLRRVAERHSATPAQVALAALMAQPGVVPIPKAVRAEHLRDNLAAAALRLSAEDLAELELAYPKPQRKMPLAMT
jgi:diketogulonate reductase-like aldo/keto reductase